MKRFKNLMGLIFLLLTGIASLSVLKPYIANAAAYANLSSGVAVDGTLTPTDTNSYQFTTNKDGEVYITLDNSTAGFDMYLLDANRNVVNEGDFSNGGGSAYIDQHLAKGTYYIEIHPFSWNGISSGSYRLKATYPGTISRNPTTFEPNDTLETAYPVNSGQFYNSKAESVLDRDVYQFTTNKDGEVYITLDNSTAGFDMYLLDANGNIVNESDFSNAGGSAYIDQHLAKGTYYVQLIPYSWSGNTSAAYRLRVTYPSLVNHDASFEPNDTLETAFPTISGKPYTSNSFSALDRDVYQFTTARDGNVSILLDNATGGYDMYLLDVNGNIVNERDFSNAGGSASIDQPLAKGTYYVQLIPYSWSGITSATYRLTAIFPDNTPTVNPVSDQSTTITGSAASNLKVYAYAGSEYLGYSTSINGKYSIPISKQKAGTVITLYTIDSLGNQSGNATVKVLDKTPPAKPTVNPVSDQSTSITGTAEPNSTIYAYVGKKMIGYGTATGGKFAIKISKPAAGIAINVFAKDSAGNWSGATTIKVLDKTPPAQPTVNTVTSKTVYVTGKAEPNSTVYIYCGNKVIGSGKVDGKGNFRIKITPQRKGTTLAVYAKDAANNRSSARIVKVH